MPSSERPLSKKRLELGLCIICGKNPLATRTLCDPCADASKAYQLAHYIPKSSAGLLRKRRNSPRRQEATDQSVDYSYVQMAAR
jgi:hypothetical protein